jgi:DNA-directed RNA polymerase alpha subunit
MREEERNEVEVSMKVVKPRQNCCRIARSNKDGSLHQRCRIYSSDTFVAEKRPVDSKEL